MPITLPPISRRRFVAGSLAALGASMLPRTWAFGLDAEKTDPHRVALLSDTHIAADPATLGRKINMSDQLRQVVSEVLKLSPAPANVLLNGDFAFNTGESADYASGVKLLKPLRKAGMPIHIGLGNHDNRERFLAALPEEAKRPAPLKDTKHVMVLETPRANWVILDSLDVTNKTPGQLGGDQLAWLAKTLDAAADKVNLVMVHHNPDAPPPPARATKPDKSKVPGLIDAAALLDILSPRKQAKALIFGHTHRWSHEQRDDGLHLVNLPTTAYVFSPEQPSGWTDARLEETGATFELHTLDPKHAWSGQKLNLTWRGK
jgi:3',5'-cyclic AMP phosphodiesterase CpdA